VLTDVLERRDLLIGEDDLAGRRVVTVGAQQLRRGGLGILHALLLQGRQDVLAAQAQVLRRVVRPEVGAVPDDRAVLLQTSSQEDLLPLGDLLLGEDDLAGTAHRLLGKGHGVRVGAEREDSHDEEPEYQHECDALHPTPGYGQLRGGVLLRAVTVDAHV